MRGPTLSKMQRLKQIAQLGVFRFLALDIVCIFLFVSVCVCVFIFLFYVSFFLSIAVCSLQFLPLITPVVSLGLVLQHSIDKIAVSLYLLAPFFYPGPSTVVEPSPHSRHLLQLCGHGSKSVSLSVGRRNWRQVSRVFLRNATVNLKSCFVIF